jgi:hypothetical protein
MVEPENKTIRTREKERARFAITKSIGCFFEPREGKKGRRKRGER